MIPMPIRTLVLKVLVLDFLKRRWHHRCGSLPCFLLLFPPVTLVSAQLDVGRQPKTAIERFSLRMWLYDWWTTLLSLWDLLIGDLPTWLTAWWVTPQVSNGDTEFSDMAQTDVDRAGSCQLQTYETPPKVLGATLISRSQITSNPVVHLGPLLLPQPRSRALLPPLPALGTVPQTSLQSPCWPGPKHSNDLLVPYFLQSPGNKFCFPNPHSFCVFTSCRSSGFYFQVALSHTHLFIPTQELPATSWGPQLEGPLLRAQGWITINNSISDKVTPYSRAASTPPRCWSSRNIMPFIFPVKFTMSYCGIL